MRYLASDKLEIIRTVERAHLPAKQTLDMLGIPRTTFFRWYRYVEGGFNALADRSPRPKSVWNRIPQDRRDDLIEFALEHEALTTRELALKYTDEKRYFISQSSAYRFLKEADLITAPDYVVIKAAEEFTDKTTAINEMWQTDFTYFKIIGWSWMYLSTVLDDCSRYIIAWKLVQHDAGRGRHRYAGSCAGCLGLCVGQRASQTAPAVGQWTLLHRRRAG